ncbi:uncharacterized protein LOC135259946 [Anguilla rostrata]|uniref:uncharacterized protein LOC135259946 n=1 Tax=Anguilla rostrata TaxID=7938 RepID=UPI0030D16D8D
MDASILHGLISILIFQPCESHDGATATPLVFDLNAPLAVISQEEGKITDLAQTARTGANVTVDTDTKMKASETTEAEEKAPGDTYVPVRSRGSEVIDLHGESNAGAAETNDLGQISTSKDRLLNTGASAGQERPAAVPPFRDSDEANKKRESAESELDVADLETWRIGAISVVATLSLGIVIAVYCHKFRKRTVRQEVPVKNTEDREAAETINRESNKNIVTAGDSCVIGNVSNESSDLTMTKQEANLPDISWDCPTEAASSHDPS